MRKGQLRIVNPCHEDFSKMRGPAQRKFCDSCRKHVHDLSSMTEAQATQLLDSQGDERICVRYRYGADGRIKFRPTPRTAAFVAVLSLAMAACTGYAEPDSLENPEAAVMCRDANGYAIDCDLVDEGFIPDDLDPGPSEQGEVLEGDLPVQPGEVDPVSERTAMGDVGGLSLAPDDDDVESCPLPTGDEEHMLMGDVERVPQTRRDRRQWRREERRDRRQRRRRGTRMGRVDPF